MTGCCYASSKDRANFSQTRSEIERWRFTSKEYDEETGLYYMSARYMNPVASRWMSSDPSLYELINPIEHMNESKIARNSFNIIESQNPYSYSSNNPIKYNDPTGHIVETVWDIASLAVGCASLAINIKQGDVKGAAIDGVGILADALAVAVPCIPGGAGVAIKAARAAKVVKVVDNVVSGVDSTASLATAIGEGDAAGIAVNSVGLVGSAVGLGGATDKLDDVASAARTAGKNAGTTSSAATWGSAARNADATAGSILTTGVVNDVAGAVNDAVTGGTSTSSSPQASSYSEKEVF